MVFSIFMLVKKFLMKSSITTDLSTTFGYASALNVPFGDPSRPEPIAAAFLASFISVLALRALKSFKSSSEASLSPGEDRPSS